MGVDLAYSAKQLVIENDTFQADLVDTNYVILSREYQSSNPVGQCIPIPANWMVTWG